MKCFGNGLETRNLNEKCTKIYEFGGGICNGQPSDRVNIIWNNDDRNVDFCRSYPCIDDANIIDGQCSSSSFNTSQLIEKETLRLCDPSGNENVVIYESFGMDSTAVKRFNLICEDQ